jgi:xylose isomerase
MYHILRGGGFTSGGLCFDAKVRRQSIDPDDMVHAHAEAMDLCARALLIAAKMVDDKQLEKIVDARYEGWKGKLGKDILGGKMSLAQLAKHVEKNELDPQPRSGRQERLEALVNNYI